MSLLDTIVGAITNAPTAAQDIETEVQDAKMYGVLSLALLAYIAVKVSKR